MDEWERWFVLAYTIYSVVAIAVLMYVGERACSERQSGERKKSKIAG